MERCSSGLARFKVYADAEYYWGLMRLKTADIRFSDISHWGNDFACASVLYTFSESVQGYKSYSSTEKSIVIPKGTRVKLVKYYVSKWKQRILVRLQNGRATWINDRYDGNTLFKELYYWA